MTTKTVDVQVRAATEDGSPFGEFEAVLSAPTLDRDGEVIDARAFEPLPASLVIHADHRLSVDSAVARAVPSYDDQDRLVLRGYFASDPDAQRLRAKIREGIVDTMSAGFMAAERVEKDGIPHITRAELLEGSFVTVPSNREALVLAVKSSETPPVATVSRAPTGSTPDPNDHAPGTLAAAAPAAAAKSPADVILILRSRALADAASVA